jgi:hypothetical protein
VIATRVPKRRRVTPQAATTVRSADYLPHGDQRLNAARNPYQNARIEEAFGFGVHEYLARGAKQRCCAFCRLTFF